MFNAWGELVAHGHSLNRRQPERPYVCQFQPDYRAMNWRLNAFLALPVHHHSLVRMRNLYTYAYLPPLDCLEGLRAQPRSGVPYRKALSRLLPTCSCILQIALINPGCKFLHVEHMSKVAIAYLRAYPSFSTSLVSATIQNHNCRAFVLHLNIEDKIRVLLVNRAARLLPLRFNDQVIRPAFRMVKNKVTILWGSINTHPDMEFAGENWLLQNARWNESVSWHKSIILLRKVHEDKPFQDCARSVSLSPALNRLFHAV